jgi:aromatic-L-amino-acid decarboxylase
MSDPFDTLELTHAQRDALGRAALAWCLDYFNATRETPIYPAISADALRALAGEPLPRDPELPERVMEQFAALAALGRKNGHPRMFGYVQSSGSFAGAVGDFLASALNQNVTSWRSAPSATTIERQTIGWLASMLGLPSSTAGLFVSGGSAANFAALATALRASTREDINQRGVAALGLAPVIYAASTVHMSIPKAAAMLGIGRDAVRTIPVDTNFQMDVDALDRALSEDRAAGRLPISVVASAGDVNTGAIDPLDRIADICARQSVWFHVDAAYGGFAALAPSVKEQFRGLARADSVALDPHKWLYAPVDVGCLLVRDYASLHRTFSHGAAYVDVVADEHMSDFAFWDYGPELSRRFRALKVWFALKLHGVHAIAAAIESNIQVARQLADAIDASDDFERLAPVPLSIVCFRHAPRHVAAQDLDALNRRLMVDVQRDGDAYLSNAVLGGAFALRACIVNYRTAPGDAERVLSAIRRVASLRTT